MGLELPDALTEPLSWIGLDWPQADEELLFAAGQAWIGFAGTLRGVALAADAPARQVWQVNSGDATSAFEAWWSTENGPQRRLDEDAVAAEIIGAALIAFAVITLAMKIAYIVQLVLLAIAVAEAIAAAFATFGATTAAVPGFVAATRVVCRQLLKRIVDLVQTTIKELFERAKLLLRKVAGKGGRRGPHMPGRGPGAPGPHTTPRYQGKPMLEKYRHETEAGHPENPFGNRAVRRLSPEEREAHRIFVDDQGIVRSARDGSPFDTRDAWSAHGGDGRAIFVMDERGNMFASKYQNVGEFHHSTLANGQPVSAAGELSVVEGRMQYATAASGHYQPSPAQMNNFAQEMARNNVHGVPVYDFTGSRRWF